MTVEHQLSNLESWTSLQSFVDSLPEDVYWKAWKSLAQQFLTQSLDAGLNRFFRVGRGMTDLIFSTLDHHGLNGENCVIVELWPPDSVRLTYSRHHKSLNVEYVLDFDTAFPTFQRFLNQLWINTMPEAIPSDLRPVTAPVLAIDGS
jgi:hypothetical protein